MATKKRAKPARAGRRTKPAARRSGAKKSAGRAGARKKAGATKATARRSIRPHAASKPAAARSAGGDVAQLKARFAREKTQLEKRLTDTVREIGQLRHHEARVAQLERQLKERDETIGQLRSQLSELRNRPLTPIDDEEIQPSLALGSRVPRDLDEFDEDAAPDDDDDDELV